MKICHLSNENIFCQILLLFGNHTPAPPSPRCLSLRIQPPLIRSRYRVSHVVARANERRLYSVFQYRVIQTLVKVWENSRTLRKHSPAARVPTAFLVLPNEMQYAIRELYPTDRKDTSRSERIAKHTAQFTTIKSLPNDMQYTIGILYSTDRKDT